MSQRRHSALRQGDVLLLRISADAIGEMQKSTPDAKGRVVLAYGEVSGHAHVLDASVVQGFRFGGSPIDEPDVIFVGGSGASLRHEDETGGKADHDPIPLEPGAYRVLRQREYDSAAARRAAD